MLKLLHFRLGGHYCAIHLASVVEVIDTGNIRKIPGDSSNAVTGFVRLREKTIPVIDLTPSNGFPEPPTTTAYSPSEPDGQTLWLIDLEETFSAVEKQALKQIHAKDHTGSHPFEGETLDE